jgi:iron complex outermembrane recepter protein
MILLAAPAGAQDRAAAVTGRVVDASNGAPIAMATVAVMEEGDLLTGTVTDPDGRFEVFPAPGAYDVEVSFVGFGSQTFADVRVAAGEDIDLGTVRLEPDVEALEGVEITAERQRVEIQIDRTVYTTADDPLVVGGTATDVLETIPSVDVDIDGNVSLRGSGSVAVLINGRPAPVSPDLIADYLRQLPADIVERVEVIPNPSARYEPDGMAGVLNIILKEDADPGLGGSLSASADTRGSVNSTNLISYGSGRWSLSANYAFRSGQRERERNVFRINRLADPVNSLDETAIDDRSRTTHRLGLNTEYAVSPRTTLTASAALQTRAEDIERRIAVLRMDAAQTPAGAWHRSIDDDESRRGADLRVGFRHAFPGEDHRLAAQARADFQARERNERVGERPTADADGPFRDQITQLYRTDRRGALDVDYERRLAGFRVETGYSGFFRLQARDFFSESRRQPGDPLAPDVGLINESDYALWIHALYGQAAREFGPLGLQAGVRLESARTDFSLAAEDQTFTNTYVSAFPSAFAVYEIDERQRLRASYSRRVNRPRTDHLNPFPRFDDPLNVYVGNPAIRPEYTNAFEFGYVRFTDWGSLTASPFLRHTTDLIRYVVTVRDDGATVRTVDNLSTSTSYGLEAIVSYETDAFRGYASLEGFRQVTDGTVAGAELQNDALGWGGRVNASYRLAALGISGATLQASAFYRAPMRTEQGRTGARLFTGIALRQQFMDDRLSLSIRARDPLGVARSSYVFDQPALYQEVVNDWGAQRVGFSLTYRFNQPERRRGPERAPDGDGDFGSDEF